MKSNRDPPRLDDLAGTRPLSIAEAEAQCPVAALRSRAEEVQAIE